MEQQVYYIQILKERLSQKQKENSLYSLRAYARDLDLHGSTLSQILKNKRGLPFNRAHDVAARLKLAPKEKKLFLESLLISKTTLDKIEVDENDQRFLLDESYYKVIAEWEHFALLELFNLEHFDLSTETIAHKLGITINRAEVVLDNLLKCGLVIRNEFQELERAYPDIKTTEDIASSAIRESHSETLRIGLKKLEEIEVEFRDFSSTTVAIDLGKLKEAKKVIREFRQKMTALLNEGEKTEVYQLAIQFYPLSELETTRNIQ